MYHTHQAVISSYRLGKLRMQCIGSGKGIRCSQTRAMANRIQSRYNAIDNRGSYLPFHSINCLNVCGGKESRLFGMRCGVWNRCGPVGGAGGRRDAAYRRINIINEARKSTTDGLSSGEDVSAAAPQLQGGEEGRRQVTGPRVSTLKVSTQMKQVLRPFANLKLAIAELGVIALLSAVGTVIEQNKPYEFYAANYPDEGEKVLGFVTSRFIYALQLDHIYSSWYFLMILGVLALSLTACTLTTQWPMVKVAQRWRFRNTESAFNSLAFAREIPNARIQDLGEALIDKKYQIFVKDGALYGFKGLAGKLAPIGVHASMLLAMGGIVVGILGGFSGTSMIPEGSAIPFSSILQPATLIALPPKGASGLLKVDDFRIQYRSDGSIQQFFTDVSVEDAKGNTIASQTMSVNKPFRYGGITAYQTDWSMSAVTIQVGGEEANTLLLPMASLEGKSGVSGKLYAAFLPIETASEDSGRPKGISFLAKDFESIIIYNSKGEFVGVRRPTSKKPIQVDGIEVVLGDIIGASGMEFKSDPGVPLVYAGFGGMCITTVLSYLSHSQVWGAQKGSSVILGGKSNRASVAFDVEMENIIQKMPEI